MKKQSLLVLGWLALATPVAVHAQFNYTVTNGTVTITGYTGTEAEIAIPTTINGLPVTIIGESAFAASSITGVTIPNSVISIGADAFAHCSSLTNLMVDPLNSAYISVDGVLFNKDRRHSCNILAAGLEVTRSPAASAVSEPMRSLDAPA